MICPCTKPFLHLLALSAEDPIILVAFLLLLPLLLPIPLFLSPHHTLFVRSFQCRRWLGDVPHHHRHGVHVVISLICLFHSGPGVRVCGVGFWGLCKSFARHLLVLTTVAFFNVSHFVGGIVVAAKSSWVARCKFGQFLREHGQWRRQRCSPLGGIIQYGILTRPPLAPNY